MATLARETDPDYFLDAFFFFDRFDARVFVLAALFFFALAFVFFRGSVTLAETMVPRQFG